MFYQYTREKHPSFHNQHKATPIYIQAYTSASAQSLVTNTMPHCPQDKQAIDVTYLEITKPLKGKPIFGYEGS